MSYPSTAILLRDRPEGLLGLEHFEQVQRECPVLQSGDVLLRSRYLSLDPYMLSQIVGRHVTGNVQPGDCLNGEVIAEVIESADPRWSVGQTVRAMLGWQTAGVMSGDALSAVPEDIVEPSWCLSMLGMPGLTAYAGLQWQAGLAAGETVLVSAASGAVGSVAVQLAREAGCRVVGIVGSEEKCRYVVDELGAEACINRRDMTLGEGLERYCPNGVDVYLDLVGGPFLEAVSQHLAVGARVVMAGVQASSFAAPLSPMMPAQWIKNRARLHGLVVYDYESRRDEFLQHCVPLANAGRLKVREERVTGLENAPEALLRIQSAAHEGKVLIEI